MKFPKTIMTYCPGCNTHTKHSASIYSHGKRRTLSEGQRRYLRKLEGYGSSRKPKQKFSAKITKRMTVKLQCKSCGYTIMKTLGRLRKLELIETR